MNYKYCTLEELVDYLLTRKSTAITQQISYYRKKGDDETVVKIQKARILAKQKKLQSDLEAM